MSWTIQIRRCNYLTDSCTGARARQANMGNWTWKVRTWKARAVRKVQHYEIMKCHSKRRIALEEKIFEIEREERKQAIEEWKHMLSIMLWVRNYSKDMWVTHQHEVFGESSESLNLYNLMCEVLQGPVPLDGVLLLSFVVVPSTSLFYSPCNIESDKYTCVREAAAGGSMSSKWRIPTDPRGALIPQILRWWTLLLISLRSEQAVSCRFSILKQILISSLMYCRRRLRSGNGFLSEASVSSLSLLYITGVQMVAPQDLSNF